MQIGRDWFQRNGNSRRVCPTSARARLPGTFEFRGRPGAFFQISGGAGTKKSISTGTVGGRKGQTFATGQCLEQAVKQVKAGEKSVEMFEMEVA